MRSLDEIVDSPDFVDRTKSEQAEVLLWYFCKTDDRGGSCGDIVDLFNAVHLHRPNPTRLKEAFKKSKNVRRLASGLYAPTRNFQSDMDKMYGAEAIAAEEIFDLDSIPLPQFLGPERLEDLKLMVRAYARIFLLENSMREFIAITLSRELGDNWWDQAANSKLKRKHEERLENESKRKWAPARHDTGPLYALDWPDLISLMRKYQDVFEPILGSINFLHRFEDMGIYRNVVAHNGVLDSSDDIARLDIYLRDWIKQLA